MKIKPKRQKNKELGIRKFFEVFVVLLLVVAIILMLFAGLSYGFKYLNKQISANVVASEESKADNIFMGVLITIFTILMVFILIQVFKLYREIRVLKK